MCVGTFALVRGTSFREHRMHEETFAIPDSTAKTIRETRLQGGRIIAIGTTVVRALESAGDGERGVHAGEGKTQIFITPGYHFQCVDALLTNFHVPRSTLLALVSAFSGWKRILAAYQEIVKRGYRLFSFSDAMSLERKFGVRRDA